MSNRSELSLSERLYRWLKHHEGTWINGGELEALSMEAGYKGSTGSRELRLLAEGKIKDRCIQREERTNAKTGTRSVWYCYNEQEDFPMRQRKLKQWFDNLECGCQAPNRCMKHR